MSPILLERVVPCLVISLDLGLNVLDTSCDLLIWNLEKWPNNVVFHIRKTLMFSFMFSNDSCNEFSMRELIEIKFRTALLYHTNNFPFAPSSLLLRNCSWRLLLNHFQMKNHWRWVSFLQREHQHPSIENETSGFAM